MSGEFEGKSLDALYAMIASAKPEEVSGAGTALAAAVPKILDIATDLRHYISRVQWEGEGAEAFRQWGAGMVRETLVLGDFTKVVSEEMKRAGNALSEAKSAVPKPAGMCFADPEKEKARIESETGPKLQEAIQQMERLSSYYDTTSARLASERQPEFKPIDGDLTQTEREYGSGSGTGSGTYSGTGSGTGTAQTSHTTIQRAEVSPPSGTERQPHDPVTPPSVTPTTPTRPDSEVDTNLDSVKLTPPPETTNRPPTQPPLTTTLPPATNQPLPPVSLPPMAPPLGQQNGLQQPRQSVTGLPSPATRTGLPGPSTLGPVGITGGKQVPGRSVTGQQMGRMPMSTVIGEERNASQYGRGAAGMHGPSGGMHGGPTGSQGGSGRRLATQPGGTIGAPTTSGVSGRSAFTPGGTGLVRPPASTQPEGEERRQPRNRPDYLSEDEETWTSGQRQIVPPVID
ncbi:WXG100 family type VII secretion target [Streptomyces sp. NPDC012637]|uniref:WXG100 family type VII secretion target n=1 Tax=Streptomyces sp. NPDC012637 TaxID=3364842 RepID=UPI0036E6E8B2